MKSNVINILALIIETVDVRVLTEIRGNALDSIVVTDDVLVLTTVTDDAVVHNHS